MAHVRFLSDGNSVRVRARWRGRQQTALVALQPKGGGVVGLADEKVYLSRLDSDVLGMLSLASS
ncbi:uncharacterized protein LY79DRAFT_562793 [Colletotrichum navitas]|uniref:Uncharacterized protein n=1 Tax=Colletotrichum navitas TaxID=681940 RepID=A0AAD8PT33_9PEZI|nr:uncharacterized protein LY79DRAFT_562793 [Colletotrichum navitas]KAK1580076.1 hypothetical protein LY79DRAFT_562793 [Colletotrichum navitas]